MPVMTSCRAAWIHTFHQQETTNLVWDLADEGSSDQSPIGMSQHEEGGAHLIHCCTPLLCTSRILDTVGLSGEGKATPGQSEHWESATEQVRSRSGRALLPYTLLLAISSRVFAVFQLRAVPPIAGVESCRASLLLPIPSGVYR